MNGPETILSIAAITAMAVWAALAGADWIRDARQRREVRRLDARTDARRRLSRPRPLP